jgi:hypothetical protein
MCSHSSFVRSVQSCAFGCTKFGSVREVSVDGPPDVDGPRVKDGRSVFRGVVLEVWEAISDGPQ